MQKRIKNILRILRTLIRTRDLKWSLKGVIVGRNVVIRPRNNVRLGENVFLGDNVRITTSSSGNSQIFIGKDVMIAANASVIGGNHNFERTDIPIRLQGEGKQNPIIVEDDVWVGSGAIICNNARIGRGSIIGAGAVVTKEVPPFSIVIGNPMIILKKRNET